MKFSWIQFLRRRLLMRRRETIYILPTMTGFIFLLSSTLMIMIGSAYENNWVNIIAFFLLSLILISMVQTHNLLRGLKVESVEVQNGFAGGSFFSHLLLIEPQKYKSVQFRLKKFKEKERHKYPEVEGPWSEVQYVSPRRGYYSSQELQLETRAPLGLFRAWSPRKVSYSFWIYPEAKGHRPLPHFSEAMIEEGEHATHLQGPLSGAEDFHELRKYRSGDPWGHIHWKRQAKTGQLTTKVFESLQSPLLILKDHLLEDLPFEDKVSQMCSWVLQAKAAQVVFEVHWRNKILGPGQGDFFTESVLKFLSEVKDEEILP